MPKKLAYHCSAMIDDRIYIHGGFEFPNILNLETFVFHLKTKKWELISSKPDCGQPPPFYKTLCTIWQGKYLVVPSIDKATLKTCTAILNLKTKRWTKLEVDSRK